MVLGRQEADSFLAQVAALVHLMAPGFLAEQKRRLVLAIGCTGGRHRSVALTEELGRRLSQDAALVVSVHHRDVDRKE